ncbi:MAG: hypothetical protein H6747_11290 [Deltaproteobacteria bacterium]|nr:hypothetical protein [Deltaproteobacteria bacterium]
MSSFIISRPGYAALLVISVCFVGAFSGCSDPGGAQRDQESSLGCLTSADCPGAQVCSTGECVDPDNVDSDAEAHTDVGMPSDGGTELVDGGTSARTEDVAGDTSRGADGQSCVGRCGDGDLDAICKCDTLCQQYGDCCADYDQVCEGCTTDGDCDDEDVCTLDLCGEDGSCTHPLDPVCDSDVSSADAANLDTVDNDAATSDASPDDDVVSQDGGSPVDAVVSCSPVDCDDGNPCTTDTCADGTCTHAAAEDGAACGSGQICKSSTCSKLSVVTKIYSTPGDFELQLPPYVKKLKNFEIKGAGGGGGGAYKPSGKAHRSGGTGGQGEFIAWDNIDLPSAGLKIKIHVGKPGGPGASCTDTKQSKLAGGKAGGGNAGNGGKSAGCAGGGGGGGDHSRIEVGGIVYDAGGGGGGGGAGDDANGMPGSNSATSGGSANGKDGSGTLQGGGGGGGGGKAGPGSGGGTTGKVGNGGKRGSKNYVTNWTSVQDGVPGGTSGNPGQPGNVRVSFEQ